MTTFLSFVVLIALFIIGKFIYDTYFTNNTEKYWNEFKRSNPESAARIDRSKGLDFSGKSKSREADKRDSLLRMANNIGCSPIQVKDQYIKELKEQQLSANDLKEGIQNWRQKKYEESKIFNIDPEDTASAFMELWTKEFFDNKEYSYRQRTESEVVKDILTENPDLDRIIRSGKSQDLNNFLGGNPDLRASMLDELSTAGNPGDRYWNKAMDLMYPNYDYIGAIKLINKGLEFDEPLTNVSLYSLRSECNEYLSNNNEALADINKALEIMIKSFPTHYGSIGPIFGKRAEIKEKIGDLAGATQDNRIAEEYNAKHRVELYGDDENR